jgi:hypothetical protein
VADGRCAAEVAASYRLVADVAAAVAEHAALALGEPAPTAAPRTQATTQDHERSS